MHIYIVDDATARVSGSASRAPCGCYITGMISDVTVRLLGRRARYPDAESVAKAADSVNDCVMGG